MKFAVVCASNMNRSMEAHYVCKYALFYKFSKKGLDISSFGTNTTVKIPGPSPDRPNIYPFGTTYEYMFNDLKAKDLHLYTQNGLLYMLERNKTIKPGPERFQECKEKFDVIFTCEERCFEIICEGKCIRLLVEYSAKSTIAISTPQGFSPSPPGLVFIINFEIRDTQEDATVGARSILHMALALCSIRDSFDDCQYESIDQLIYSFQEKYPDFNITYSIFFY